MLSQDSLVRVPAAPESSLSTPTERTALAEKDVAEGALKAQSRQRRAGGAELGAQSWGRRAGKKLTIACIARNAGPPTMLRATHRRDTHMAPTWTCDPPLCLMHRMGGVLGCL
jgi:hypothetical protein